MIVELVDEIKKDKARIVNLAEYSQQEIGGISITIFGWGSTSSDTSYRTKNLMFTNMDTLDKNECENMFSEGTNLFFSQICTLCDEMSGPCLGDSGGPAFIRGYDSIPTQIGIISGGFGCNSTKYPSMLTSVYSYKDFIQTILKDRSEKFPSSNSGSFSKSNYLINTLSIVLIFFTF